MSFKPTAPNADLHIGTLILLRDPIDLPIAHIIVHIRKRGLPALAYFPPPHLLFVLSAIQLECGRERNRQRLTLLNWKQLVVDVEGEAYAVVGGGTKETGYAVVLLVVDRGYAEGFIELDGVGHGGLGGGGRRGRMGGGGTGSSLRALWLRGL